MTFNLRDGFGDVGFNVRVLEAGRCVEAGFQGNSHVPAEKEHGVQPPGRTAAQVHEYRASHPQQHISACCIVHVNPQRGCVFSLTDINGSHSSICANSTSLSNPPISSVYFCSSPTNCCRKNEWKKTRGKNVITAE